jgi:hypothetical protein
MLTNLLCQFRLIKRPFKLFALIKELNKNGYDLTISPAKSSGSSNIMQASVKQDIN